MTEATSSFLRGRTSVYRRVPRATTGGDVAQELMWPTEPGAEAERVLSSQQ